MEVYSIVVNSKYTTEIDYLTNIASSLKEFGYDINLNIDDSVEVINYLLDGEIYHSGSFLDEQGLLSYIDNSSNQCSGCSGSCSSC